MSEGLENASGSDPFAGLFAPLPSFEEEDVQRTTMELVHTAERQGSTFVSSMAEGFAEDWLTWGGVDVRAASGLVMKGIGLVQTMTSSPGAGHALAFGDGVFASWVASMGVKLGQQLATNEEEKKKKQTQPDQPATEGEIGGPIREVTLTPEPDYSEVPEPERFVRAGR